MTKLFFIPMDFLATFLLIVVGLVLAVLLVLGLRNRVMLRLGLRNIPRRRAQTALIIFGLMLSTLIVSAAFGTGDTMTYSFRAWVLDEVGELDELIYVGQGRSFFVPAGNLTYFDYSLYQNLADQIDDKQVAGDNTANKVQSLTPAIQVKAPVINVTKRQSEPGVSIVGYKPQADDFDKLFTLDGAQVRVADLSPAQVYLNEAMAEELKAEAGHQLTLYLSEEATSVTVKAVVKRGGLSGQIIMPLEQAQTLVGEPNQINSIMVSNAGGSYSGVKHSSSVAGLLKKLLNGTDLKVQKIKQQQLNAVEVIGSAFTTIFIAFGSFSIAAGLLLIFLIFVMLAAERKQEMGMARAVGTRRGHLIQMFVFEGAAYDLAAAAVGALLGVLVGFATVEVMARGFESVTPIGGFRLRYHIEPRSLVVAYCLGMLLTFVTVSISSWRVSVLNIVAAIRDLPPPPNPDAGLQKLFLQPWRHLTEGLEQLRHLKIHRVFKRIVWDGPVSSLAFLWGLINRGPLALLIGALFVLISLSSKSAFAFNMGVSLVIVGLGLVVRWLWSLRRVRPEIRDRLAFSFNGIGLLVFWSLPFDALDFLNLPKFKSGPEMFLLSGVMMVTGAVWTIIYNSDILLTLVTRVLSPFGNLLPVVRTAIAYPMSNKFRTGLTLAMFALIIFTLVFMSIFVHIFNQTFGAENIEELTGGYDIEAETSEVNPITDMLAVIADSSELDADDFELIAGLATRYATFNQPGSKQGWSDYTLRIMDDAYLQAADSAFILLADGYESAEQVWQAMRENPGLAVVDSFAVPSKRGHYFRAGGPEFHIEGVHVEDESMQPIPALVRDPYTNQAFQVEIIGVIESGPMFYAGVFISEQTLMAETGQTALATRYFIKLADDVDVVETAQTLESVFLEHGLEANSILAQVYQKRSLNDSMMGLIQAFMGLGLVVGIAALGVISTRAVVERRHQIGMLRAIGYRRWMIQWSFLLESSFVALLGIFMGLVLGSILAFNYFNSEVALTGSNLELTFAIPWDRLGVIVAIAYGASLLTTFLPAWQAARVYPAEALRYE